MSLKNFINHYKTFLPTNTRDYANSYDINLFGMFFVLLSKLLKDITASKHFDFYKKYKLHQTYCSQVHNDKGNILLENPVFENQESEDYLKKLKNTPHIITTFHLGLYMTTAELLLSNGIEFAALMTRHGSSDLENSLMNIAKEEYKFNLKIIDAENPSSALSLIRELKSGKNLLIFTDGYYGASKKRDNLCEIEF